MSVDVCESQRGPRLTNLHILWEINMIVTQNPEIVSRSAAVELHKVNPQLD